METPLSDRDLNKLGNRFIEFKIMELTGITFEQYLWFPESAEAMARINKGLNYAKGGTHEERQGVAEVTPGR